MQEGDVFGSKDYFSGLAVMMDTYSNHNGPHNVGLKLFCTVKPLYSKQLGQYPLPILRFYETVAGPV